MKKKMGKILSSVLALAMVLSLASVGTFAAEPLRNYVSTDWDLSGITTAANYVADTAFSIANGSYTGTRGSLSFYGVADAGNTTYSTDTNALTISRISTIKQRNLNVVYTPSDANFLTDTAVIDFTYRVALSSTNADRQIQTITLYSAVEATTDYATEYPALSAQPEEGQPVSMFTYLHGTQGINLFNKDSIVLFATGTKLYAAIADTKEIVEIYSSDDMVNIYNIRAVVKNGKYDLYVEKDKVGMSTKPVLTNVSFCGAQTGAVPTLLRCNLYSEVDTAAADEKYKQSARISDVSYSQQGSKTPTPVTYTQNFTNASAPVYENYISGGYKTATLVAPNWYYNLNWNVSSTKYRFMGYMGVVNDSLDSANQMLRLGDIDYSTLCTYNNATHQAGGLTVDYKNALLGKDNVSVSLEFKTNTSGTGTYAQMIALASKTGYRNSTNTTWNGFYDGKEYIVKDPDSIPIYIINDGANYTAGFYYGDSATATIQPIPNITFVPNTKYYVKIDLNNKLHTYDLYISTSPVTESTLPVLTGLPVFNPSATPLVPTTLQFLQYSDSGDAPTPIAKSDMYVDNLSIVGMDSSIVDTYVPDNTLKFYGDDGWAVEGTSLPNASFVDLYGALNEGIAVLVAYDQNNQLKGAKVLTPADGIVAGRISYDYDTASKVKLLQFDSMGNIKPLADFKALTK